MEWLIVGFAVGMIAIVMGMARAAGRADDHAERCAELLVIKFGVDTREFDDQINRINEMNWRWRLSSPEPEPVTLPAPWDDPTWECGNGDA